MFEGNEDLNIEGRSLVDSLSVEFGIEVGTCDGMPYGRDVGKLEGSCER